MSGGTIDKVKRSYRCMNGGKELWATLHSLLSTSTSTKSISAAKPISDSPGINHNPCFHLVIGQINFHIQVIQTAPNIELFSNTHTCYQGQIIYQTPLLLLAKRQSFTFAEYFYHLNHTKITRSFYELNLYNTTSSHKKF